MKSSGGPSGELSQPDQGKPRDDSTALDPAARYCLWCHASLGDASEECPSCRMSFNPADARTLHGPESLIALRSAAIGILTAITLGVFTYLALRLLSDATLMGALFVSVPLAMGAIIGYLARLPVWGYFMVGSAVIGMFCGFILLFVLPLAAGILLGRLCLKLVARSRWAQRRYLPLAAFAILPFLHGAIDRAIIHAPLLATVSSEETIEAPPGQQEA